MPTPVQFLHDPASINSQSPAIVCIADKPADPAALARQVISHYLNLPINSIHLAHDPHGRPYIQNHAASLSIAHAGSVLAIALARHGRIGVDLERIDPNFDFAPIARDHFTPAENNWLNQLPPDQRPTNFARLWTAKEALLKALGLGLTLPMSQIEFAMEMKSDFKPEIESGANPEPRLTLHRINQSPALAAGWQIITRNVSVSGEQFSVSVVLSVGESGDQVRTC